MKKGPRLSHRILLMALFLPAAAMTAAENTFSIYWENDSRFTKPNGNTDRHYTSGLKLVYSMQPDWPWLRDFAEWDIFSGSASVAPAAGFFLGQNMYTPNHAEHPARRSDKERVFAGWLYTGMFIQRRQNDILDHFELNIGVVGPSSKADRIQRCTHTILRSGKPVGWDEQIGDEPAANVMWVRRQRHTEGLLSPTEHTDVITDIGFTAGSLYRHIEAGIMLRWGMHLPDDFGPGRLSLAHTAAAIDWQNRRSLYLFGRLAGRAVEYDRFLTGLTHRPLVGRAEVGVVCRLDDFEIAYTQTYITEEFKEQGFSDSYGALTLTWLF